jgi:rhamnopyranosyl-N-acetylglucosaminyl-diphospho-decaprenol beta-1,3/1,4-galactofuranosyltransferase
MSCSIASVTTARNAKNRLPRQLDALARQSFPLQEVVVVDDQSGDGTGAMLAERYPEVTVIRTAENLGAAGAWAVGLAYAALQKRHDWVWTFDDDTVPNDDALKTLIQANESIRETENKVGMLTALPIHEGTQTLYSPLLWREGFFKPPAAVFDEQIWFADLAIASGCMVRRDVVEQIGLPRADFFMDFADFEYCLRARSRGYKIAVVSRSKVSHQIGNARQITLPVTPASGPSMRPGASTISFAIWLTRRGGSTRAAVQNGSSLATWHGTLEEHCCSAPGNLPA